MKRSLEGVRILDFTRLLPGPFGTQILGDLGAQIVKVEDREAGDYTRRLPPLYKNMGSFFCSFNRNKRSIKLDLKKPEALDIVHRLVRDCGYDVVTEGFRPGVAQRLGIDYDSLCRIEPGVIQASLPGFGDGSSRRDSAAHDIGLLALSGILSVSGNEQTGPAILGIQIDDLAAGMYFAVGILAALHHRKQTGEGQRIEVTMADAALALNATNLTAAALMKKAPSFAEHHLSGMVLNYQIYKTKDGRYLSVGAVEPKFWINACNAFDLPELINEQGTPANDGEPAYEKLKARVAEKTLDQWKEIFRDVDACVEPVLNSLEALEYPHYRERNMVENVDHPLEGQMTHIPLPVKMSATPAGNFHPVPEHGEHTDEILSEAGFSTAQIEQLRKSGVVG